jgi:hypothetical protein|tara:strand:+ start:675 stop:911 length:237 start_codon:yes stop_codon:yes gene_type:complete
MEANLENKIEKIINYKTWSDRRKIDVLLEMDCVMYTNLGIESTLEEKRNVKMMSKRIYRGISKLDKTLGDTMMRAMDR